MNIKLHNKFEITIGNNTYTFYNTLLKTVYGKISNLEQYTSHIAVGLGQTTKSFNDTKLGLYQKSFATETEEIQSDVTKGTLYIKKVISLEESDTTSFSFSELGLTSSADFDPIIYNHVLLTDTNGNVVTITRNSGDAMQIRVTIYLELNSSSSALFVKGENNLIKQILGENLQLEDNNLYIVRGENLLPNEYIERAAPNLTNATVCEKEITYNDDDSVDITFSAEIGEGDTEEILIVFGGKACLRLNTLEIKTPISVTNTYTCLSGNTIEVDKNVKNITSVLKTTISDNDTQSTQTAETNYTKTNIGKKLTDKITNLFDQPFTNQTPRYVAKDGSMIAFIYNSHTHIYKYSNYGFTKINSTQVPSSSVMKMFLFENIIVVLLTVSPYIQIFNIVDNNAVLQELNLSMYDTSVYPYNWIDAEATLTKNNKILIGFIVNNENNSPLVLTLTQSSGLGIYNGLLRTPTLTTAKKVFSIYKNAHTDSLIGFITDTFSGVLNYLIEEFYEDTSQFGGSNETAYGLLATSTKLQVGGRTLVSKRTSLPYYYITYLPDHEIEDNLFTSALDTYLSYDGNYIIVKNSTSQYQINNFHICGESDEFESGFPSFVDFSLVDAFEFVGNLLLVFTTNPDEYIYGIAIKNQYTLLENLSDETASYEITYNKYNLLGSQALEGVKIELKLTFGEEAESASQTTTSISENLESSTDSQNEGLDSTSTSTISNDNNINMIDEATASKSMYIE